MRSSIRVSAKCWRSRTTRGSQGCISSARKTSPISTDSRAPAALRDDAWPVLAETRRQLGEIQRAGASRSTCRSISRAKPISSAAYGRSCSRSPFGQTRSYAELARAAGSPRGTRAAGAAIGRNPVSLVVPCHRVRGHDGSLTGYTGGIERKRALLRHERVL